jgi:hypothetical protein
MSLEDQIFLACDDEPRDWTNEEREFIRGSESTRKVLARWYTLSQDLPVECWTPANSAFIEELKKEETP